ncbi:uncharacterized protein LOC134822852 [Bolinopsis microptera]|uniref:uncharacterized protein LOC134822852 n=1 Tax=Bolinopsis microptera TaxID=2820187 RepID=UPI0030790C19
MTDSILNNLRWKLDGKFVNNKGFTYNKHHDVIIFKMMEKVYGTTTVQWKIIVAHSTAAVGNLYCRAQYSTGQIVDTPMSHLNEIRIDSDLDLIVLTPDTGAVVTFITHAPSAPLSRNLDCSLDLVNPISKSTDSKISTDGLIFTEVYHIRSSDSMIEAGSKDDLVSQHGTCDYSVRIQNSVQESLTVTVKFSLLGEAVVITPVLATVGRPAILTTYFTARDLSDVRITWQKRNGGSINWESLPSDHQWQYRTLISPIDDKGVMSTKLFIQRLTSNDVTDYRAVIFLSGQQQTCDMICVKSAQATISKVKAVFERSTAFFTMSVLGDIKPLSVFLHYKEGNKDIPISLPDFSAVSGPYTISHRLEDVYFCDGGHYSFRIKLETGFEFSTDETNLKIKLRCKPPRTPPNTLLKKVEIAESDDYKYVVTCINEDLVLMNENAKEVICNTSTGSYHTKIDLSPCLRVIEQIYP